MKPQSWEERPPRTLGSRVHTDTSPSVLGQASALQPSSQMRSVWAAEDACPPRSPGSTPVPGASGRCWHVSPPGRGLRCKALPWPPRHVSSNSSFWWLFTRTMRGFDLSCFCWKSPIFHNWSWDRPWKLRSAWGRCAPPHTHTPQPSPAGSRQ